MQEHKLLVIRKLCNALQMLLKVFYRKYLQNNDRMKTTIEKIAKIPKEY